MPYRNVVFVKDQIYHVFNRSIARQPIFKNKRDYQRIIDVINFYCFGKLPLRFSHYERLPKEQKDGFNTNHILQMVPSLEILSYCIMPNHFHFLLKPNSDNAISNFMRNIQNSYSKYFNTKYKRTGSLFQFMFKAIRIETDEQLIHVSRYIHLNPVTAYIIEVDGLDSYMWSSYKDYFKSRENNFVNTKLILSFFKSNKEYKDFIYDGVDYQRQLDKIKHLLLE